MKDYRQEALLERFAPNSQCKLCGEPFFSECLYHEWGVCGRCANKITAAFIEKHTGEPDGRFDPAGYAKWRARHDARLALKPKKAIISATLRRDVFERDRYRCKHCGTHKRLCVDHVYPESRGGTLALENLQTLCVSCNNRKRDRIPPGAVKQ